MHRLYRQELHYFILAVDSLNMERALDRVKNAVEAAGLKSWNAYAVYGSDDLLVRLWTSDTRARRFRERVETDLGWKTEQLAVDGVKYLWGGLDEPHDEDLLFEHNGPIEKLAENRSTELDGTEAVQALVKANLVAPVPPEPVGGVRVYIYMTVNRDRASVRELLDDVESKVSKSRKLLHPTLHWSADAILVKAHAPNFEAIREGLEAIYETVGERALLRTKTLIVAASAGGNNDVLALEPAELTPDLKLLSQVCGPGYDALIQDSDGFAHSELTQLYRANVETVRLARQRQDRATKALAGIVGFRCTGKQERLEPLTGFLHAVEGSMKSYLRQTLTELGGSSWFNDYRVRAVLEEAKVRPDHGGQPTIDDCTWGQVVRLAGKTTKDFPEVKARLQEDLGSDWAKAFEAGRTLRNAVSHPTARGPKFIDTPFLEWSQSVLNLMKVDFHVLSITEGENP